MSDTSVTLNKSCTRCRRTIAVEVNSPEEAFEVKAADAKKAAGASRLSALVEELKSEGALPDLFTAQVVNGELKVVSQVRLCDETDAKRSCLKTAANFVESLETLPERAPRGSKKKTVEATTETTETAAE